MTAPDTNRQKEAFPKVEQYGARVVGAGKPDLPGGTWIPATKNDEAKAFLEKASSIVMKYGYKVEFDYSQG